MRYAHAKIASMFLLLSLSSAVAFVVPTLLPAVAVSAKSCTCVSAVDDVVPTAAPEEELPPPPPPPKCPDCDQCDGSGRILGGIAALGIPWPIKAYRPCPVFVERGGVYTRKGQALDEIAFGQDPTFEKNK